MICLPKETIYKWENYFEYLLEDYSILNLMNYIQITCENCDQYCGQQCPIPYNKFVLDLLIKNMPRSPEIKALIYKSFNENNNIYKS